MSLLVYSLIVCIGVGATIFLGWLLTDWALAKLTAWRNARDLRVRNERLNRFNLAAFRGTKERRW